MYCKEDYIQLSDEAKSLISDIDTIGKQLDNMPEVYFFYNGTDKREIFLELAGGNGVEDIFIRSEVDLQKYDGWTDVEKKKRESRIMESLTSFKNILEMVKNGDLCLDNPEEICDNKSLKWFDNKREKKVIYNYELFC